MSNFIRSFFCLSTLSSNTSGQLDVFRHDSNTLGVDSAQVGVFKQTDQVRFRRLLQSTDGCTLETQIGLEVLGNLAHQTLEWQLADEQLSRFLVTTNLTKGDGTGPNKNGKRKDLNEIMKTRDDTTNNYL